MIKYLGIFLIVIVSSCSQQKNSQSPITPFADFLKQYHEERQTFYPLESTYAGETKLNHLLPIDISQKFIHDLKSMYLKYQQGLANYDVSKFSEVDQLSYDILKWECEVNLDDEQFENYLLPINQFNSLHLIMGTFASGEGSQPFKTVKDYNNWLQRLDAYVIWLDTAMVNMHLGIQKGIVLPKALTKKLIPQFEAMTITDMEKHLYYSPIRRMPADFSSEDKSRLSTAYESMIKDKLVPRFKAMTEFLKGDYLTASRESSGISELTNGKIYYAAKLKEQTTTHLTPEEIHQLGLNEVSRIKTEMEKVMAQVGFKGSLKEFFDHVRQKKELMPFNEPKQVIDNFYAIYEKMKPNLSKLFDLEPKSKFEIRRTEAFREASASAEYNQGSIDGTRPGIFYVPIPNVKTYNLYSDEDLFLHEAIPGHHYQISLAQENTSLPEFRKLLWYGAYGEGWALYSESLGQELGLYQDPYQYFGMLGAEMHRSIRLVVDTGMHAFGWSREKAIQYSMENEAESEESITSEIERYMAWPGQACSYKIGQLKIRELRSILEKRDGQSFDVKKFHRMVLESGCLPLAVLEKRLI